MGLKSSVAVEQSKISFAIQEVLTILDRNFGGVSSSSSEVKDRPPMTRQLKEMLEAADVIKTVEPFWNSNFKQQELKSRVSPPFFGKSTSHSYLSWLSLICRYLVERSKSNKQSVWGGFFYACRSAIRSKAGDSAAEFLLPLFILDAVCFGENSDEDIIVNDFLSALSFDSNTPSRMNLREREKVCNAVFTVLHVLRHWMEREIEDMTQKNRGRSKRASSSCDRGWPADKSIRKIDRFLKRIPLSSCAMAANEVGMRARALRFLEMDARGRLNRENVESKFVESCFLTGVDTVLIGQLLGQLNDFDTMVFVGQKNNQTGSLKRLAEEASQRELNEDWEGSCQAYEQLLDSRLRSGHCHNEDTDIENDAQEGLLRSLLKLGRLDSVLNQAYGMSKQISTPEDAMKIRAELLPSATEAAWRLGNWGALDELLTNPTDESSYDSNERYQLSFGRTMSSLHSKSQPTITTCLKSSREAAMSSLAAAARDGYVRSYPYLVQLHSLREVECIALASEQEESYTDIVSSDEWNRRLELSSPEITGSIRNTRLALTRMVDEGEPMVEGSMWLDIGKAARKSELYQVAEHSLTQANVSFCKALNEQGSNDGSSLALSARDSIGRVKLQIAKLKHDVGESMAALKLVEDDIPASICLMDEGQLKTYVASNSAAGSGEALARRILQSTEWMVCDGLKSTSEIKTRYQTVLRLAPKWERGMELIEISIDLFSLSQTTSLILESLCNTLGSSFSLCEVSGFSSCDCYWN